MARHPKVFDTLFSSMIAAGEAGGILDTILQRLAIFIEKIVKLKRALRSAMIYPSIILFIAVAVVTVIMWKVIPVFRTLFEGFNVELPPLTRIVIANLGLCPGVRHLCYRIPCPLRVRLPKLPQDRKGQVPNRQVPFAGARAWRDPAENCRSAVYSHAGDAPGRRRSDSRRAGHHGKDVGKCDFAGGRSQTAQAHRGGEKPSAEPMRESRFFPPMVTQMVSVGEATGELDTMLVKVADYYEEEVDVVVANMLTILEPICSSFWASSWAAS